MVGAGNIEGGLKTALYIPTYLTHLTYPAHLTF